MSNGGRLRVFEGAVAIVTGGASGIGLGLGRALAERHAEVILADRQVALAEEQAGAIRAKGRKATAVELDVTDYPAVERLVKETAGRAGRIDFLFNNAGIGIIGETQIFSIEDWNRIIDVNLRGVVNGVHAAYGRMLDQGFGHIVNTASSAGLGPTPLTVAYSATKHAVVGLSISLRAEAAATGKGVRVSVICPGVIRTPILEGGKYGKVLGDLPRERRREIVEWLRPMDPDLFARKVLDQVARNRAIIVEPFVWKVSWLMTRLSPDLGIFVARKLYEKVRRELGIGAGPASGAIGTGAA